jgi:hypothetical protein
MPDWVSLVRYCTCSGIVSFFSFRYWTDWMPDSPALRYCIHYRHGYAAWTRTYRMDMVMDTQHNMDMQHGQGHAAWTYSCSMDMDMGMQHRDGHGHAAWT